jgi:hypothetical protein
MHSKLLMIGIASCFIMMTYAGQGSSTGNAKEKSKKTLSVRGSQATLLALTLNTQATEKLTYQGNDNKTYIICDNQSNRYSGVPTLKYHAHCPVDILLMKNQTLYKFGNNIFIEAAYASNETKYLVRLALELTKNLSKGNNNYIDLFNNDVEIEGKNLPDILTLTIDATAYHGNDGRRYHRKALNHFVQE